MYKRCKNLQKKIKVIWNRLLEENFVPRLINNVEIQVKYDVDNLMSNWKIKVGSYMEDIS